MQPERRSGGGGSGRKSGVFVLIMDIAHLTTPEKGALWMKGICPTVEFNPKDDAKLNNPVLTHSQIEDVISKQTLEPVSNGGSRVCCGWSLEGSLSLERN